MIFSLGGKKEPVLRPMKRGDLAKVIEIINEHDEDDAEEAAESLQDSLDGIFVLDEGGGGFSLENKSGVFGVIGARQDPDVQDICWLSWTYVAEDRQGQGWGRMMMENIIEMLRENGIRKLFISTSNYEEDGEDIYAAAKGLYQSVGAELELTVPDFHDKGEDQLIYGLPLLEIEGETEIESLTGTLEFYDVNPMPESEMGFALNWEMHEGEAEVPPIPEQLKKYVSEGKQHRARILISTLPSDIAATIESDLKYGGFTRIGELKDFHAPGLHEEYWVNRL